MEKFKTIDEAAQDYAKGVIKCSSNILHKESEGLIHTAAIFGATEIWRDLEVMDFGNAIKALRNGKIIRRKGWNGKGLVVFKQVPAHITGDIIPKMQSLPESAKQFIMDGQQFINYTSQCLIYNSNTGQADSWVPSISDVFSEDWEVVETNN